MITVMLVGYLTKSALNDLVMDFIFLLRSFSINCAAGVC